MKALIAMSGGVDSSAAAFLTQQAGYEAVGCTMKLLDGPPEAGEALKSCCGLDDIEDARAVARKLGMSYYVFNFKDEFSEQVIGRFVRAYRNGETPNPCIDCNRYLKFGKLLRRAEELNCACLVTGHYARVVREGGAYLLKKALDASKDQSYVLYSLTQEQLARIRFPLGEMRKSEVRALAEAQGLVNARKKDSQDICFVPDGDYAGFIEGYTGQAGEPGDFVGEQGEMLGRHRGIIHYTVGQRRGLGIPAAHPLYVRSLSVQDNTVHLGRKETLFSDTARLTECHWIAGETPPGPVRCGVKIRYRHPEQGATVYPEENGGALVVFDAPQRAVTPGQAAVFYDGDTVLGGGRIAST